MRRVPYSLICLLVACAAGEQKEQSVSSVESIVLSATSSIGLNINEVNTVEELAPILLRDVARENPGFDELDIPDVILADTNNISGGSALACSVESYVRLKDQSLRVLGRSGEETVVNDDILSLSTNSDGELSAALSLPNLRFDTLLALDYDVECITDPEFTDDDVVVDSGFWDASLKVVNLHFSADLTLRVDGLSAAGTLVTKMRNEDGERRFRATELKNLEAAIGELTLANIEVGDDTDGKLGELLEDVIYENAIEDGLRGFTLTDFQEVMNRLDNIVEDTVSIATFGAADVSVDLNHVEGLGFHSYADKVLTEELAKEYSDADGDGDDDDMVEAVALPAINSALDSLAFSTTTAADGLEIDLSTSLSSAAIASSPDISTEWAVSFSTDFDVDPCAEDLRMPTSLDPGSDLDASGYKSTKSDVDLILPYQLAQKTLYFAGKRGMFCFDTEISEETTGLSFEGGIRPVGNIEVRRGAYVNGFDVASAKPSVGAPKGIGTGIVLPNGDARGVVGSRESLEGIVPIELSASANGFLLTVTASLHIFFTVNTDCDSNLKLEIEGGSVDGLSATLSENGSSSITLEGDALQSSLNAVIEEALAPTRKLRIEGGYALEGCKLVKHTTYSIEETPCEFCTLSLGQQMLSLPAGLYGKIARFSYGDSALTVGVNVTEGEACEEEERSSSEEECKFAKINLSDLNKPQVERLFADQELAEVVDGLGQVYDPMLVESFLKEILAGASNGPFLPRDFAKVRGAEFVTKFGNLNSKAALELLKDMGKSYTPINAASASLTSHLQ